MLQIALSPESKPSTIKQAIDPTLSTGKVKHSHFKMDGIVNFPTSVREDLDHIRKILGLFLRALLSLKVRKSFFEGHID